MGTFTVMLNCPGTLGGRRADVCPTLASRTTSAWRAPGTKEKRDIFERDNPSVPPTTGLLSFASHASLWTNNSTGNFFLLEKIIQNPSFLIAF